ncbi:MAG: Hpt domain-containing protein [Planctomycetaceae bacterium]
MTSNMSAGIHEAASQIASSGPLPIDSEGLMSRCLGKISFALMLLEEFESSGKRNVEKIVEHVERNELLAAAEAAHALKGTAGIIGAEVLQRLAAEIEDAGRGGQSTIQLALVHGLRAEMGRCLDFIPAFRSTAKT